MFSRGAAVIRGKTLIVNLPGSPRAVQENLGFIITELHHGLDILSGRSGECARP
jgi:molybdopterin biosynthesis enzyme MoaB